MGLGQWPCFLKTPLRTFGVETAVALIAPHISIILEIQTYWVQGWRQELNFQTQKDRIKSLS